MTVGVLFYTMVSAFVFQSVGCFLLMISKGLPQRTNLQTEENNNEKEVAPVSGANANNLSYCLCRQASPTQKHSYTSFHNHFR